MDESEINLLDLDRFTEGIPHEWFTYLRHHAPIYHHPEPAGPGFWVFSKYDDVVAIGRDAKHFSSDQGRGGVVVLEDDPAGPQLRDRADDADHGSSAAHPLPPAGQPGLHAADDRDARAAHPRGDRRASSTGPSPRVRWTSSPTPPPSCRCR